MANLFYLVSQDVAKIVTSETYWDKKLSHIRGELLQIIHVHKVPIITFEVTYAIQKAI